MDRSVAAGVPGRDTPVPDIVRKLADGGEIEPVWRNELGGVTFRVRTGRVARYIKWQPDIDGDPERSADVNLVREAEKLRWAGRYVPVPVVIDVGRADGGAYLVTRAVDAVSAVDARWRDEPEAAVRAIATGLRRLHDRLPVAECPYRGAWLPARAAPPEPDLLVVCHGDACVPNTLLHRDGRFAAHVDLARLGVADRWADLAIATYSISWGVNFGRSYDDLFFDTYGVSPDPERVRAYRALWDAG